MKTNTEVTNLKKKKKGFTLIEVIAVLVLLGIIAAVALPQYNDLTDEAERSAIEAGVAELNAREAQAWGKALLNPDGFTAPSISTDIGPKYGVSTSAVTFGDSSGAITFSAATSEAPANWLLGEVTKP